MVILIPIGFIIFFILVRKFYKWKAKRANDRRVKELKEQIDWLLSLDDFDQAITD